MANKIMKYNNKALYWNEKQIIYVEKDPIPTSGLVAEYKFEENVNDSLGNYNLTGDPASYVPGKFGYAANYTGQESYNVNLRNIFAGTNSFSISVWLNINAFTSGTRMVFGCDANNSSPYQRVWLTIRYDTDKGALIVLWERYNAKNMGAIGGAGGYSNDTITAGEWNHLVLTYKNGDTYPFNIYINNSPSIVTYNNGQYCNTNVGSNTGFISAGPSNNNQNNATPFSGLMDNMRIYNRALTSTEVGILYNE